jgi:hypothetical protein
MRCPSCGTENAPDSRFCGGCGARLTASTQRVAPTQKISDEASFPQPPFTAPPGHGAHVLARAETARVVPTPAPYAPGGPVVAPASVPEPPRAISPLMRVPEPPRAISPPMRVLEPPRAISSPPPAVYAHPPAASVPSPNSSVEPVQPRPRTAQAIDDPSLSMPIVARRPWGLILIVLVIDIGLALAGVWMLSQGLGDRPRAGDVAPRPGPLPSESK